MSGTLLAALPMYLVPQEALDAFWNALATRLRAHMPTQGAHAQWRDALPTQLLWPQDYHAHWREPHLLLSQACGYPLTTSLRGQVQLVGTFAYDVPHANGVVCRSVLICRSDDVRQQLPQFDGAHLVCNETGSQSGYNALRAMVAQCSPALRFGQCTISGGHNQSIESVRTGAADLASIDCVSYALWQQANPALAAQVRVFATTDDYPGLPLITSLQTPPEVLQALQAALREIAHDPAYAALRAPLRILGFEATSLPLYARCLEMEASAAARGVTTL
jgi:ABC-type phosphate/phosphonate transport system substrate-binding protein